jgi:hypothetical protein
VAPGVVEYIHKGSSDFAWGFELPSMVAVGEHGALARKRAVGGAGKPNQKALHAAGKAVAVVALDEEVNVIALDAVLDETTAKPSTSCTKSTAELAEDALLAQGG